MPCTTAAPISIYCQDAPGDDGKIYPAATIAAIAAEYGVSQAKVRVGIAAEVKRQESVRAAQPSGRVKSPGLAFAIPAAAARTA